MKVKEESEKVGLKLKIQTTKIMASGPITSWQIDGETMEIETLFSWAAKSLQMVTAAMKLKMLALWKTIYQNLIQNIKRQRNHFAYKGLYSQMTIQSNGMVQSIPIHDYWFFQ